MANQPQAAPPDAAAHDGAHTTPQAVQQPADPQPTAPVERVEASVAPVTEGQRRRRRALTLAVVWGSAAILLILGAIAFWTRGRL